MSGTLFVVATPIGNLEDLSPRARRILSEVSLIAAEDTRTARVLLEHSGLSTPCVSYHDHNELERTPELLARLEAGQSLALISEAGLPAVSDPGFRLIRAARLAQLPVIGIPGPCAVVTALAISGLPTDRFLFVGFLPARGSKRRGALLALKEEPGTLVCYESPQRVVETLTDIQTTLGPREVALARELTKRYEEVLRGTPADVQAQLQANDGEKCRGEMTLVIAGSGRESRRAVTVEDGDDGKSLKKLAKEVADILGVPRREAYRALSRLKEAHGTGGEADDPGVTSPDEA